MKLGFTLDFRNPLNRPWRELWNDNLGLMCEAERLGFDRLLLQEHFFQPDGYGPSMPVFLALLCERTAVARIGSFIYILPFRNPAQLAQETAVIDHLSGGRLDVMVGGGHDPREFRAFGLDPRTRPSRMEEGLTVLKRAWTERPFSFKGRWFELDEAAVRPEPLQQPHPPLWVGATSVAAAERTARHRAHLAAGSLEPEMFAAWRRALEAEGVDPDAMQANYSISITTTTEDPEAVWRRNADLYVERWSFYGRVRAAMGDQALKRSVNPDADPADFRHYELIGSPQQVVDRLAALKAKFPLTEFVHSAAAGLPPAFVRESLQAFAEEVMPEVRRW